MIQRENKSSFVRLFPKVQASRTPIRDLPTELLLGEVVREQDEKEERE